MTKREPGGAVQFAGVARRIGAAARAAGLAVPAFRTPPRHPHAKRTIRRLPGGPVVSVRVSGRPIRDVTGDLVEGVVVANGLSGEAAHRVRDALRQAATGPAARRPAA